jgi:hypothetical protein
MYQMRPPGVVSSNSGGFFTGTASAALYRRLRLGLRSAAVLADDDFEIVHAIHSTFLSEASREQGALVYAVNCRPGDRPRLEPAFFEPPGLDFDANRAPDPEAADAARLFSDQGVAA